MATNDKIRVSTLDDWYLALSKMYNDLKTENKIRYDKDVGKNYDPSSKLNIGARATATHISHVVNGINALNGKDSDGNIPTDKDDLKVYFWYSDWKTPPGEIQIGDTKIKIRSHLKNEIDGSISELKQICVNNSKEKVLYNSVGVENTKSICDDYICTDNTKTCFDNATQVNATIPTNSQTYHSTSYNSRSVSHNKGTVTTTFSETPTNTVKVVTSDSKKTTYSQSCSENSKAKNSKDPYNVNCNQVEKPGCKANITNSRYYTNGKTTKNSKSSSNSNNSKYTKKTGYDKSAVTSNSVKPGNAKIPQGLTNSTSTSYDRTHYSTEARNTVTPNTTVASDSKDLSNTEKYNSVRIQNCIHCAPDCAQDIRCQTYNIGYSVKANGDGTYKTFVCSDTKHLDKYLYIK